MAVAFGRGTTSNHQVARALNGVLGVWLFISAFIWPHTGAQMTNTWILGALCVIFAVIALGSPTTRWLNTVLAIWLFISVWALPHQSAATMWNNALVAIAIFLLSLVPGPGERPLAPSRTPA